MKKAIRPINIAGRWTMSVDLDLHGGSMIDIGEFLIQVQEEFEKGARKVGNRKDINVNLKGVMAYVGAKEETP